MSFQAFENATQSEVLRELIRHWHEARGDRRMPGWSDIRPAAIKSVLPVVWSWKYDRQNKRFTGRLEGDRIHKLFGSSHSGRTLEECFPHDHCVAITPLFRRIVMTPEFFHEQGPIYAHLGTACTGERVALPLADDGENSDGIIGASYFVLDALPTRKDPTLRPTTEEWFPLD